MSRKKWKQTVDLNQYVEFIVPKPPAPPKKPSSSALANAAGSVSAPDPEVNPITSMVEAASKTDIKEAGKAFNGNCLDKEE